jgi:hypothetical protein
VSDGHVFDMRMPNAKAMRLYAGGAEVARFDPEGGEWHLLVDGQAVRLRAILDTLEAMEGVLTRLRPHHG